MFHTILIRLLILKSVFVCQLLVHILVRTRGGDSKVPNPRYRTSIRTIFSFEHKKKGLLICIISPRQVSKFQNIINKYPETFAYVGSVNEIYGKFNKGEDIYK